MTDSTTEVTTPEEETTKDWEQYIDVNGEKLTVEELKNWYLRQSDYTRKTQELSKKEKELESRWQSDQEDPEEVLIEFMKKNKERLGFASVDEIKTMQQQVEQEKELENFMSSNPELKKFEKAIRTLQKTEWWTYEEIILDNWFLSSDKLEKAKARPIVGVRNEKQEKSLLDLSPSEREKKKAELGIKTSWGFVKKQTV